MILSEMLLSSFFPFTHHRKGVHMMLEHQSDRTGGHTNTFDLRLNFQRLFCNSLSARQRCSNA